MALVAPDITQSRRHLLIVGNVTYKSGWTDISEGVRAEVEKTETLFLDVLGYERPTYKKIIDPDHGLSAQVAEWCRGIPQTADEIAVVYWTGHGDDTGEQLYLITPSVDATLPSGGISASQLLTWILQAREPAFSSLLLMLDTCHSGIAQGPALYTASRLRESMGGAVRSSAIHIIASTHSNDMAFEATFADALDRVLRAKGSVGASDQEWLPPETVIDRVNRILSSVDGATQRADFSGRTEGTLTYFPNPHWAPRLRLEMEPLQRQHVLHLIQNAAVRNHWSPRSRGVAAESEPGWYFTGRSGAFRGIQDWIRFGQGSGGLAVIGPPGSGKSALLARLVTLADPDFLKRARGSGAIEDVPDDQLPAPESIAVAVHARAKTSADIALEILAALDAEVPVDATDPAAALLQSLIGHGTKTLIVVDGLDEADQPLDAALLLRTLVERAPGVRVIVGARSDERGGSVVIARLGPKFATTDLAKGPDDQSTDVRNYVERVLRLWPGSPYADSAQDAYRREVSDQVAKRARHSFLVALTTARALARRPTVVARGELGRFPADIGSAFDYDFERFALLQRMQATYVFGAVAQAKGRGLPASVWPALATGLSGQPLEASDISYWLENAGFYVTSDKYLGLDVVRLYHEEFASYLRHRVAALAAEAKREEPVAVLARVLEDTATIDVNSGARVWKDATYALAHLPTVLMEAHRLDDMYSLVQSSSWIDAKRREFGDLPPLLEDLRLTIYSARFSEPIKVDVIVRSAVIFSRLMTTAPPIVVDVLAALGQPGRALSIAQNITYPLDRAAAYCFLAERSVALPSDARGHSLLEEAVRSARGIKGSYGTMAKYWIIRASLALGDAARAQADASSCLEQARAIAGLDVEKTSGAWLEESNHLFWTAMALRAVGDEDGRDELRRLLAKTDRREFNLHLQTAAIAGDDAYLLGWLKSLREDSTSTMLVGNLALALATANRRAEAEEVIALHPRVSRPSQVDCEKRLTWAVAMLGRVKEACELAAGIPHLEERARALFRIARIAAEGEATGPFDAVTAASELLLLDLEGFVRKTRRGASDEARAWTFSVFDAWRVHSWLAATFLALRREPRARALAELVCAEGIKSSDETTLNLPTQYTKRQKEHVEAEMPASKDAELLSRVTDLVQQTRLEEARAAVAEISATESRALATATIAEATPDSKAAMEAWLSAVIDARRVNRALVGSILDMGRSILKRAGYAAALEHLDQDILTADATLPIEPDYRTRERQEVQRWL